MIEVEEGVEVPLDVYFVTYNEEPVVFRGSLTGHYHGSQ